MCFRKWCNNIHRQISVKFQYVFNKIYPIFSNSYNLTVTKPDLYLWKSYRGITSMFDKIKGVSWFFIVQEIQILNLNMKFLSCQHCAVSNVAFETVPSVGWFYFPGLVKSCHPGHIRVVLHQHATNKTKQKS